MENLEMMWSMDKEKLNFLMEGLFMKALLKRIRNGGLVEFSSLKRIQKLRENLMKMSFYKERVF